MSVIMMLESEHKNLDKLLQVIEREVIELEQGRECDRKLLNQVVEYWRTYPDQCHHPKEELILRKMTKRHVPGAERLCHLVSKDHDELLELSEHVAHVLDAAQDQGINPADGTVLQRFVDRNRRHMMLEEQLFFPVAVEQLDADAWDEIEFDLLDRDDPVFNRSVEARYHMILDAILAINTTRKKRSKRERTRELLSRGATTWLEGVNTVEDFNDIIGTGVFGGGSQLRAVPAEGYVLEQGSMPVTKIPQCDEKQAVWCAYFYLLGFEFGYGNQSLSFKDGQSVDTLSSEM